jgi:protein arginine kinase
MNLPKFLLASPHWLQGGKGQGIILSSRVRLARNLSSIPFPPHAMAANKRRVVSKIKDVLSTLAPQPEFIPLNTLGELEHGYLLEKRLISTQLLKDNKYSAVAIWSNGSLSALINEEDHLRIQAIEPGIMIDKAYQSVRALDQELQRHLTIAKNSELGYLTSCPTNIGTGMRVSLFCHLPGMAMSGQIEETLGAMVPAGIAIRGFFGESSAFLGNIFQVSNQITLGLDDKNILSRVHSICNDLIEKEKEARKELLANAKMAVMDRVCRTYGILTNARSLDFPEFIGLLSNIRLGIDLKWIHGLTHRRANRLMMETQPAHLLQKTDQALSVAELAVFRAEIVRQILENTELTLE